MIADAYILGVFHLDDLSGNANRDLFRCVTIYWKTDRSMDPFESFSEDAFADRWHAIVAKHKLLG